MTSTLPATTEVYTHDELLVKLDTAMADFRRNVFDIAVYLHVTRSAEMWKEWGYSSWRDFLSCRFEWSSTQGNEYAVLGSRLIDYPALREAVDKGLGPSKAKIIGRIASGAEDPNAAITQLVEAKHSVTDLWDISSRQESDAGEDQTFLLRDVRVSSEFLKRYWKPLRDYYEKSNPGATRGNGPTLEWIAVDVWLTLQGDIELQRQSDLAEGKIPDELREAVLERDNHTCRLPWCSERGGLTPHHILFKSQGGADTLDNIVTLCLKHHNDRHAEWLDIFVDDAGCLVFQGYGQNKRIPWVEIPEEAVE